MPEDGEKATADSKAAVYPNLRQVQAATPGTSGQAGNPFTGTSQDLFRRDPTLITKPSRFLRALPTMVRVRFPELHAPAKSVWLRLPEVHASATSF
jgi:hypothetical protein